MADHPIGAATPDGETSARRAALFRETAREKAERAVFGAAWALMPKRAFDLWPLAKIIVADLVNGPGLPPSDHSLARNGLAGIARDLSVPTLIAAHERGLFPGGHTAPVKWLAPPERCVLFFNEFHIARRLRRIMRQGAYSVTFDRDFERVIKTCAGQRAGRWHVTWITPRIMRAYADLFDAGYAHSFEVWNKAGELAGGGYGVALGGFFTTESQFSLESNTSKLGFTALNWHLARWGFGLNDGKNPTPTILDMGFRSIPRREFLDRLGLLAQMPGRSGRWEVEADLKSIAEWEPRPSARAGLPPVDSPTLASGPESQSRTRSEAAG